jgi:hypothetical protein
MGAKGGTLIITPIQTHLFNETIKQQVVIHLRD